MKKTILIYLAIIFFTKNTNAIDINGNVTSASISRSFILHAPGAAVAQNLPVMIVMHGDGGSGANIKGYAGFDAVADSQNFMAIYPNAISSSWNRYVDNVPGDAGLNNPNAPDDVLFISDLIDYLCTTYGINKNKVYACGHSAGGFMAYNLALTLPTKIAAFAPVAGGLWGDNAYITQKLGAGFVKVPIYHVHGDADGTVDYPDPDFAPVDWEEWPLSGFSYPDCSKKTYLPADVTTIVSGVQKIQFCPNSATTKEVSLIRIIGGGHGWPAVSGYNCAQEIYNFCKSYSLNLTGSCVTVSSAKEILTFSIPNQVGSSTISSSAATIAVTMPATANLSSLTPTFTLSALASSNPLSGVAQNFSTAKQYTVTAQDGSTKIWTVTVNKQSTQQTNSLPNPCLIGYLHNWDDAANGFPYIQLDQVDSKYNVINYAFANTNGNGTKGNISLVLDPAIDANSATRTATFITKMQTVQAQGRKVLLSIGGAVNAGGLIHLATIADRDAFISSTNSILNTYPFDGIDINMEDTCFIFADQTAGNVNASASPSIDNFVFAIKSIMSNYRTIRSKKMILTFAPERPGISGGRSSWQMTNLKYTAAYLPIIQQLRDSLDAVHVQLYGVANDIGYDGIAYNAGTVDGALANLENLMNGYTLILGKGIYNGLPADKTVMGVASDCIDASQNPLDTNQIKQVLQYLKNEIAKPGSYTKQNASAVTLRGMMVWSINLDNNSTCGKNDIAAVYTSLFKSGTNIGIEETANNNIQIYPNPVNSILHIKNDNESLKNISIYNAFGEKVVEKYCSDNETKIDLQHLSAGFYFIKLAGIKSFRFIKE